MTTTTTNRPAIPVISINGQSAVSGGAVAGGAGQFVTFFLMDNFPELGALAPAMGAAATALLVGLGTWVRDRGGILGKVVGWLG